MKLKTVYLKIPDDIHHLSASPAWAELWEDPGDDDDDDDDKLSINLAVPWRVHPGGARHEAGPHRGQGPGENIF